MTLSIAKGARGSRLTSLPVEILLEIYHHLDLDSVFEFAAAHGTFRELFVERKAAILLPTLAREFSPFDELLQVYTASDKDLESTEGRYKPRRVIFKRCFGDSGTVLAPRPEVFPVGAAETSNAFTHVVKTQKPSNNAASATETVILAEHDLGPLLKHCRIVREWEERFPQMRWFHDAENCRLLRPHEMERFRRAFYRWWLYGFYFHGEFPRPSHALPEPHANDIRISQLRWFSTGELLELMDLVETMKDVVLHYICPRLDPCLSESPELLLMQATDRPYSMWTGWNDSRRWGRIVKTYAKLGPKELMQLFENIYSYPRQRLIAEARQRLPNLTLDQESIQISIKCVLDERGWGGDKIPSLAEASVGGIVDFDDERDEQRRTLGGDGMPGGGLPLGAKYVRSFAFYSPRGDDGWYLEEFHRQGLMGGGFMDSVAS